MRLNGKSIDSLIVFSSCSDGEQAYPRREEKQQPRKSYREEEEKERNRSWKNCSCDKRGETTALSTYSLFTQLKMFMLVYSAACFSVFRTTRMAWHLQKLRAAFELRGWLPWRQVLQQCPASWTGLSQSRVGQSCFVFLQFTFPDTLPRRLFCCQRKIKTNTHTLVSSSGVTAHCREKKSNTTCGVRSH